MVLTIVHLLFTASVCPHLKKRYHARVERVREYHETVRDFDELISPQSLFLHFLGPEPSNHIRKNIEIVKKSKQTNLFSLFIFFMLFLLGVIVPSLFLSRLTTRFSKAKLAEVQEKKARAGLTSSLLTRKRQRDAEAPKDDPMMTSLIAMSIPLCPASPISSLELIASTSGVSKAKKKDKAFPGSF